MIATLKPEPEWATLESRVRLLVVDSYTGEPSLDPQYIKTDQGVLIKPPLDVLSVLGQPVVGLITLPADADLDRSQYQHNSCALCWVGPGRRFTAYGDLHPVNTAVSLHPEMGAPERTPSSDEVVDRPYYIAPAESLASVVLGDLPPSAPADLLIYYWNLLNSGRINDV